MDMRYIHQIVTKVDRNVTTSDVIYSNSDRPKISMNVLLEILKDVQYEIVDRKTNQIQVVGLSK